MRNSFYLFFSICLLTVNCFGQGGSPNLAASGKSKKLTDEQISKLTAGANQSIAFVENKGQWPAQILYKADVPGGQMQVTTDGMLVAVFDRNSLKSVGDYDMKLEQIQFHNDPRKKSEDPGPAPTVKGHGWKLHFTGATKATTASIEREGENVGFTNYFTSNASTSASHVHSYNIITYKDVYPGINVKYYTAALGNLENDIIVKPGADAGLINMQIEGIDALQTDGKGGLILPTTLGNQVIASPVCYLLDAKGLRTEINLNYHLTGKNTLKFDIPVYDKSQTLVIDPIVMRWSAYMASTTETNNPAHCHGVDLDAEGNIYVCARGADGFIATTGAFQLNWNASGTADNLWITKYQEPVTPGGSGVILWATYLGGANTVNPYACSVGPDGYLYITGITTDDLPTTYGTGAPAINWTNRVITDPFDPYDQQVFIAKLDPTGSWAEVREMGSAEEDAGQNINLYDIRILPTGANTFDLIAIGDVLEQSNGAADGDIPIPQYPNGTQVTNTGGVSVDGWALRITNDLNNLVWTKQYITDGAINQFRIGTPDGQGNILLGGFTTGTTGVAYNSLAEGTISGSEDGWLMSINANTGDANWSRYFNSSPGEQTQILCMELNQQKTQVVIGGLTTGLSTDNISAGAYQTTYPGGANTTWDFFIASLPVAGTATTWGTYFGGKGSNGVDNMMGLNVDENNDVYVLGYTNSKFTPITTPANAYPLEDATFDKRNYDAIFFKLSGSTGDSLLYYTFLGGSSNEEDPAGERGIKFKNCRIYLAVTSGSVTFPLSTGTINSNDNVNGTYLPVIVSMANPPDLTGNTITSGGNQTIQCGQTPQPITASVPSYIIPNVIRNNVSQTNGTTGAYPDGLPAINAFQWQYSKDGGTTWISIPGATSQNYTPAVLNGFTGTFYYRRIINGDYCSFTGDTLAQVTILATPPYPAPAISTNGPLCAGQTLDLSTPTQSGFTYSWTGPDNFSSTAQNPNIPDVTNTNAGEYYLVVTNTTNGCPSYPDSTAFIIGGFTYTLSPDTLSCGDSALLTLDTTATNVQITPANNITKVDDYHYLLYPDSSANYLLTLSLTCNPTDSFNLHVTVLPSTPFSYTISDTTLCRGASAQVHFQTDSAVSIIPSLNVVFSGDTLATITPSVTSTYTIVSQSPCLGHVARQFTLQVDTVTRVNVTVSPNTPCPNDTAVLCVGVGYGNYAWNTGETTGCISTITSGNFSVTATDLFNCSVQTTSIPVVYQQKGTYNAALDKPSLCFGDSSQLLVTDTSVSFSPAGTIVWTSGTTGILKPDTTSNYIIIAPVTCGVDTVSLSIVVDNPQVQLTSSNNAICGGAPVTICANTGYVSYAWDSGGATSSCITVTNPGTYSVIAMDQSGCTGQSAPLNLPSAAVPGTFTYTFADSIDCPGTPAQLAFSGQLQIAFSPFSSVSFVDSAHVLLQPDSNTIYTVVAEIACIPNDTLALSVQILPVAPVSITTDSTVICPNDSIQLCVPGSYLSYTWSGGQQNEQCIYASQAGTYAVTVTEPNTCTAISAPITLTAASIVPFMHQLADSTICFGNNTVLSYSGASNVQLYPTLQVTRIDSASFSLHPDSTTAFTLIGMVNCNFIDTVQFTLPVYHTVVNIVNDSANIFCENDSAEICAPAGYNSYFWNNGETGMCIFAKEPGNYYVNATDAHNCIASSNHIDIIIKPRPSISIGINLDTFSVYGNTAVQWYLDGNAIPGATGQMYIANASGNYQVEVTDTTGCNTTSNVFYYTTDISAIEPDVISIYPNPLAGGSWNLEVSMGFIGQTAQIYDEEGRVVYSTQIHSQHSEITPAFARGIYFLRINSPNNMFVTRLVKMQ